MPEQVVLYTDHTVDAFLAFVAELKGLPAAGRDAHLDEVVADTGLTDVRHRLVGNLSHGYRKRVGLAQALVGTPEVLILDEPTSGLDPHQIVEIRELIRGFRGRRTVLLSSHILSEVAATCERVLILDRGRLVGEEAAAGLAETAAGRAAGHRVVLTWDGDREQVAQALAAVTGVDEVVVTDDGAEVVLAGNPVEIRPRLVESVLQAGGQLQNITDRGPSLEELFLRLTGAAANDAADAAAAGDDPAEPPEAGP
jgi:ABC-2 type transport system ATP-binding protein